MKKSFKISLISILAAIAIVLTFFKIPYGPAPWLSIDLSEIVELIAVSTVGFIGAIIIAVIKSIAHLFSGSASPLYIGEITAFVAAITFAIAFYVTKKLPLLIRLLIVCLIFTIVMIIFNFFISTPIYSVGSPDYTKLIAVNNSDGIGALDSFNITDVKSYLMFVITIYAPFNILKSVIICTVYFFIHKPIMAVFADIKNRMSK